MFFILGIVEQNDWNHTVCGLVRCGHSWLGIVDESRSQDEDVVRRRRVVAGFDRRNTDV